MEYTPCVRVFGVFLMRLQQSRLQSQQTLFLLYYIKLLQELQILLQTCITANELFAVCFDVFLQEVYSSLTRAKSSVVRPCELQGRSLPLDQAVLRGDQPA